MGLLSLNSRVGGLHGFRPSTASLFAVAATHVAAIALVATYVPAEQLAALTRPLMVRLIEATPEVPPHPVAPPPKPQPRPRTPLPPPPVMAVATPAPAPAATFVVPVQPPTQPAAPPAPAAETAPAVTAARFDADYLRNPKPIYPMLSRRLGEEGKVVLRVHVDAAGLATGVEIKASSGHPRLDTAAQTAVAQWRFVPARRGDTAIDAWVLVPIVFNLES